MHFFRLLLLGGGLLCLLGCAPVVESHKSEDFAFYTAPYRILVQESESAPELTAGLDSVAQRIFSEAGLSVHSFYNATESLHPHSLRSLRDEDSTGYVLRLSLLQVDYTNEGPIRRVFATHLYDMPSGKEVWNSRVTLNTYTGRNDHARICQAIVQQARKDHVIP